MKWPFGSRTGGAAPSALTADESRSGRESPYRLAKTVGVFVVMASAVAQEYGGGINFVLVRSLGTYPSIGTLVPWAMLVAGLLLLPKIAMLGRFSQVMPRAGAGYVWLTRSVGSLPGFLVAFLWWVGVVAAMGFLAFSFAVFLEGTLAQLGMTSTWPTSTAGHLVIGLALIWVVFLIHYSGVRNYGRFVGILFVLILFAACSTIAFGFATTQDAFVSQVSDRLGQPVDPSVAGEPSIGTFFAVVTLFMFAYGGQVAATSLGGEARDPSRTIARGVWAAWGTALVLYTVVSFALFHMAPPGAITALIEGGQERLATTPGVLFLIAPQGIAFAVNVVVIIIIGKTLAPEMLDCSRYLFAWAQDRLLPGVFLHTNRSKAPDVALLTSAIVGSVFLVEATFFGFEIGVLLRSMSIVLVFGVLGIGILNMRFNPRFAQVPWARTLTSHADALVAAVFGIIIAAALIYSVLVVPDQPLFLQPSIQALIALAVAACIYLIARSAASRKGEDLPARMAEAPPE